MLPPPSSSSNIIISDPGGRSRLCSDLFPLAEKPECRPEATESTETLKLSNVREGSAIGVSTGVSMGVSTGVHDDDITAVNTETLQRDNDMKTNLSEET